MENQLNALKKDISFNIDQIANRLVEISTRIHQTPEICFEEHKAAALLIAELEKNGFEVERNTAGLSTAFRAVAKSQKEGPVIAFLAEYDALPEIGHACGHNIIGTASLGAGIAIKSILEKTGGTVYVIGTPAEEGGGGKIIMAEKGAFDGIDISLMIHPLNKTFTFLPSLAVQTLELVFHGKAAHAAACPEEGINALDAAVQTYTAINALRQQLSDDVRIHGIISDGGSASNVIPDRAALEYGVRTKDQAYLGPLLDKVKACAEGAALATGASLSVNIGQVAYDSIKNNPPLEDAIRKNLEALGINIDVLETTSGGIGSVDIGNISRMMPAAHPFISICEEDIRLHTNPFRDAAISKRGQEMMVKGAKMLAYTAADLYLDTELFRRVEEAFHQER